MNILHVVNIYFVLPYFIGNQFKYFKEKGYNMNVACSPSEYLEDFAKEQGFEYIETPVNRSISIKEDFTYVALGPQLLRFCYPLSAQKAGHFDFSQRIFL